MKRFIKRFQHIWLPFVLCIAVLVCCISCNSGSAPTDTPNQSGTTPPMVTEPYDTPLPIPPDVTVPPATITPSPEPTPEPTPEITGPDVPLQPAADDAFFADAAFVGNSLMDGFRLFSGLTTCDYYAVTSMTVTGVNSNYSITLDNGSAGTIMQGLAQKPYGKIYILLGINEIGFDVSYFTGLYGQMLDDIRAIQPDADIYVLSLTPVSAQKSASHDLFNMTRITTYNEALYDLAAEKDCYYLDLCTALADETGYLPAAVTSDGVHFAAGHYLVWLDYIKTHYVA